MLSFKDGQRVMVRLAENGVEVNAPGRVMRRRMQDRGAWIRLDERHADESVHPFPCGDDGGRENHTLAYPEDCDEVQER